MPWTPQSFKSKHNHSLSASRAKKASKIANSMLERGVPEGEAIATANKRASNWSSHGHHAAKTRRRVGP